MFNYQLAWRALDKKTGITLVEVLAAAFILLVIISALFLVLNVGELSNAISGAKLEAQQEVRRAMDWMVRDLRQTAREYLSAGDGGSWTIYSVVPVSSTFTEVQFNTCIGHDGLDKLWSSNQIEYAFDTANQMIIRSDSDTGTTWTFNHISDLTFTKIEDNVLNISLIGQRTAIGNIAPTFTLQEEVKLRNE